MIRDAACHCGTLKLACEGEPAKVSLCHCFDCQRRTGSLFSIAAFYPRDAVAVAGGDAKSFRRPSASGFDVTFHFCTHCGSNLWWVADRLPDMIGVAVGAFADPAFPRPEQAVWAEEKHVWIEIGAEIPAHARNPLRQPPGS